MHHKRKLLRMLLAIILLLPLFLQPNMQSIALSKNGSTKVIIHYQPSEENTKGWNLWVWPEGGEGKVYEFTGTDKFGQIAEVEIPGVHKKVGFIVRTDSWEKDGGDRWIDTTSGIGEVWVKSNDESTYPSPPDGEYRDFPSFQNVKVKLHYYRNDEKYEDWNLWIWNPGKEGRRVNFTGVDEFGKVAEFTLSDPDGIQKLGFILRKSVNGNDWAEKEFNDRFIMNFNEEGEAEVWIAQGQERIYVDPEFIERTPKIINAKIDAFDEITLETNVPFSIEDAFQDIELKGGEIKEIIPLTGTADSTNKILIKTESKMELASNYTITFPPFGESSLKMGKVVRSKEFDEMFYYDGKLGNEYTEKKTNFRVWAPTAQEAKLVLYDSWEEELGEEIEMAKGENGTWTHTLTGNQDGQIYTYKVKIGDDWTEAVDPYVRAVTVNGDRGVVVDLDSTDPKQWNNRKPKLENPEDSIIYELHTRDLSIHPESGIKHKGKFLGVAEKNTKGPNEVNTGLSYMKDLGVTHVQFLPIYDYRTVDETMLDEPQFNWGYDPKNYNVPEGSYSTDPYNPKTRITELKTMIQALHDQNLRMVMDVVYNHVYSVNEHSFHKLVPGYYFRYNEDGSLANGTGVGNDTASERKMVQKFIIDSIKFWTKEYHIDGYRFDLMGIHDTQTMNMVREELNQIDPSIIVLGEGWDLNTPLNSEMKANQKNAEDMKGIAHFNDNLRDGLKGSVFNDQDKGFVNGKAGMGETIQKGIAAGMNYSDEIATYQDPEQVITYVEAHDNLTLWDKLELTNPEASLKDRKQMHKLATSIILTSQGVPFLHAGQEFMRTKDGDHNSYQSPDAINQLDWQRRYEYNDEVQYVKGLIDIRKKYQSFRLTTKKQIESTLNFLHSSEGVVVYSLNLKAHHDKGKEMVVIHNANKERVTINLPSEAVWHVLANENDAGTKTLEIIKGDKVIVEPYSTFILKR
ncbi:pullulanase [Bacillus pakistanensis]|uniref:pullulanase n=1 Tax=Rossellomorea pakistanensis TaxID=992288 RepID=A0ABS2N8H0_9BACI|nr:type I pullulanase [Bacillus pakistanensis]MBM7584128.1 pullulanase [Bacillus pakistanensis]